jgi:UPF0755 protein
MKRIYIILGIIFLVFFGLGIYIQQGLFKKADKAATFTVDEGQGTRDIASNLKKENLISSPMLFSLYVYQRHWFLQPGVYAIGSSMSAAQIASLLHEGKVQEYVVTIPEGWRVTQIDEYLAKKGIIKKGELTQIASADEGYLFPNTYKFPLNVTAEEIRTAMIDNFNKKTAGMNLTSQDIIIASIVEREAKFDEDRPKIAGVYLNRLALKMKLEADPTIQYALGSWEPITVADYHSVQSPYNTYLHEGLPPGSICNPSLKSIEATIHPERDSYLYFFTKSDGHAVFSKTQQEQTENLKKYQ